MQVRTRQVSTILGKLEIFGDSCRVDNERRSNKGSNLGNSEGETKERVRDLFLKFNVPLS